MRELTLRHLLLLVGKAIAENETDSEASLQIVNISATVRVSREKRSPYVISWHDNGSEKSLVVEDSAFRFHVRGDVPNRNPQNEDVRSSNWAEACKVWSTILAKEVRTEPNQLAPQFFAEISREKSLRVVQTVFAVFAVVVALQWHQNTGLALFGVLAINECLKIGDVFTRRRASLLMATSLAVTMSTLTPNAAPAFIALLILEIVTSVLVFTYRETSIIAIGLAASLALTFANAGVTLRGDAFAVVGFLLFSLLSIASLPRGKSGNLRRISVTFSIAVLFVCNGVDLEALWVCALFAAIAVFPIGRRRIRVTALREVNPATPVSIRQSRGL
jgi:hypothetical protein